MEKLLVVESELSVRKQLRSVLAEQCTVVEGTDRAEAMSLFLQHFPKVVVLDLGLPPALEGSREGLRCLEWLLMVRPATKVVLLASAQHSSDARRALESGAYDFQQKPFIAADLQVVVRRAFHLCSVEEQSRQLKEALERATAGEGVATRDNPLQRPFSHRQVVHLLATAEGEAVVLRSLVQPEVRTTEGMTEEGAGAAGLVPPAGRLTLKQARDTVERKMVRDAIGNCGGNMTKASELLGVSRPALYDLMKKYGICNRRAQR